MSEALIKLINLGLAAAIALWKMAQEQDPNAALLTDDQVIELLGTTADRVVATAQDWLDQHPV
jgi:hypothetical protein